MREEARRGLEAISESERALRSRNICRRLGEAPSYVRASTIMMYFPMPEEVDLLELAQRASASGKRLCLPRMDWSARTIAPLIVDWRTLRTEVREHGISEPTEGEVAPLKTIDLILVPGLAFDEGGRRLGRGAGFYDRFLAAYRGSEGGPGLALGVCFQSQVVAAIPADDHDQPMDGLATERRVLLCRKAPPPTDKR